MNCRVPGCPKIEWMGRELCDTHWRMLPEKLQLDIRNALRMWRVAGGADRRTWRETLDSLFEQALEFIGAIEEQNHKAAVVSLYRTRMAAVSGLVVTIRQLPFADLIAQLEASVAELKRDYPETFKEREIGIGRDLAFLSFFLDAREKLGEIIKQWPAPEPPPAPELVTENSQADGAAPAEIAE